jgi:hypothetical protein
MVVGWKGVVRNPRWLMRCTRVRGEDDGRQSYMAKMIFLALDRCQAQIVVIKEVQ